MQIVDQLRKIADELPNYPQLDLHRIAHEVLALQGKLQESERIAADWKATAEKISASRQERIDELSSRLDERALEVDSLTELAKDYLERATSAESRLDSIRQLANDAGHGNAAETCHEIIGLCDGIVERQKTEPERDRSAVCARGNQWCTGCAVNG